MEPEIRSLPAITVAGLQIHVRPGETDIPAVWTALAAQAHDIQPRGVNPPAYGVTFGFDVARGEFEYLAGYPVEDGFVAPAGIALIRIPSQTYAVFPTTLPGLMETLHQANHVWLPSSPYRRDDGPEFELYDEMFDPQDPASPMSFYLPVRPR